MERQIFNVRNVSTDMIKAFRRVAKERGYNRETGKAITEAMRDWINNGANTDEGGNNDKK